MLVIFASFFFGFLASVGSAYDFVCGLDRSSPAASDTNRDHVQI